MEITEADMAQLAMAERGDLLVLDHGVVRVADTLPGSVDFMIVGCEAFSQCSNLATTVIDHSVIGLVPACQRCAEILS